MPPKLKLASVRIGSSWSLPRMAMGLFRGQAGNPPPKSICCIRPTLGDDRGISYTLQVLDVKKKFSQYQNKSVLDYTTYCYYTTTYGH